jgi:soluble lytic murein transglycosylase-like protein
MAEGTDYKASDVAKMLVANGWDPDDAQDRAQKIVRSSGTDSQARSQIGVAIRETNPGGSVEETETPGFVFEAAREPVLGAINSFQDSGNAGNRQPTTTPSLTLPRFWSPMAGKAAMVGTAYSNQAVTQGTQDRPATPGGRQGSGSPNSLMGALRGGVDSVQDEIGYRSDASALFDIDPNDPASNFELGGAPTEHFRNRGGTNGRDVLEELTTGARSKLDLTSRALRLEMEDPDKLIQLQMQMLQHGLLPTGGDSITWGVVDGPTMLALGNMADGKAARGSLTWTQFFDQNKKIADNEIGLALDEKAALKKQEMDDLAQSMSQTLTLNLSSGDAIKENAQALAKSLTGKEMGSAELDAFVNSIHGKERSNFWSDPAVQQAQQQMKELNQQYLDMQGGSSDDLQSFMRAIESIESGGNPNAVNPYSGAFGLYQFMPGTWAGEAARFGLDPADKSPENQRRMAEAAMSRYYSMFGNWRDVAIAWYAGPYSKHIGTQGSSGQEANGHISIRGYADKAVSMMERGLGGSNVYETAGSAVAAAFGKASGNELGALKEEAFAPTLNVNEKETFDVNAYLKRLVIEQGGVDVDSYRYLQNAQAFENLLGGTN